MTSSAIIRILIIVSAILSASSLQAQKFKVDSFRILPNDVTAFINPVTDLNDDGCALIKVQASPEFAFSTPLGIVRREDKTGEIWLYIPKGSKKITIKHPEWGVLRDYPFPVKIESHVSYELKVAEPVSPSLLSEAFPVVTTVHDTLVVTHTDTIIMKAPRIRLPLLLTLEPSTGFGGDAKTLSGGILISLMRRHGAYVHLLSDFGSIGKTVGNCGRKGEINGITPYYSGKKRHSFLSATVGATHRLSNTVGLFEGIGYGYDNTAWQLAESEGGCYVRNSHLSHSGFAFETGLRLTIKRFSVSASAISINGTQWYGSLGVGIILGKVRHHEK